MTRRMVGCLVAAGSVLIGSFATAPPAGATAGDVVIETGTINVGIFAFALDPNCLNPGFSPNTEPPAPPMVGSLACSGDTGTPGCLDINLRADDSVMWGGILPSDPLMTAASQTLTNAEIDVVASGSCVGGPSTCTVEFAGAFTMSSTNFRRVATPLPAWEWARGSFAVTTTGYFYRIQGSGGCSAFWCASIQSGLGGGPPSSCATTTPWRLGSGPLSLSVEKLVHVP